MTDKIKFEVGEYIESYAVYENGPQKQRSIYLCLNENKAHKLARDLLSETATGRDLQEFIKYLREGDKSFVDCTESTYENRYGEYNKNDAVRAALHWVADELEDRVNE